MNQLELSMLTEGRTVYEYGSTFGRAHEELDPDYMGVEVETGELLYALVRRLDPKVIVETGTHRGYSTAWLALGLKDAGRKPGDAWLYTVDDTMYDGEAIPKLWAKLGIESYITRVIMDSRSFVPPVVPIDLVFFDSNHDTGFLIAEWLHYRPTLRPGALAVFHDMIAWPGVAPAVTRIAETERATPIVFDNFCGLALLQIRGNS